MRWLACFWAAASLATAQSGALLSNQDALKLEQRTLQLMESTGLVVPGLTRAGAPALEDGRQALASLQSAPQNAGIMNAFLATARSYLAIADTMPKPYPFPEEGRRQFAELREDVDRLDSHFRALLENKESELRNPDRDELKRYAEANEKLPAPSPQQARVVFLGDSITDGWRLKEYYGSERDFVNRGISGQITGEMLGRMRADVIDLKPRFMVVLAGTNDLARGVSTRTIENNLSMIADLAEAHHIQPMFASVLPVSDYHKDTNPQFARTTARPPAKILELDAWLKAFCEQRHFVYLDYFAALVDKDGFLQADASDDGLHPNARGYRIMAPIALAAIDKAVNADVRPAKGKKAKPAPEKVAEAQRTEPPKPDRSAQEKADQERAAQENAVKEQARQAKAAQAKASQEQAAKEKSVREQAKQAKATQAKASQEQTAQEKSDTEKARQEKAAQQKADREKAKQEKAAQEKAAKEKAEKEKADKEKAKQEKAAKDKAEGKKSGIRAWLEKEHK